MPVWLVPLGGVILVVGLLVAAIRKATGHKLFP